MRTFVGLAELAGAGGADLGSSEWLAVGQERIDTFAEATGDHQWIHVDPARAAEGPYRATIAHGYLTLSLLPALLADVYRVEGVEMAVNYGLDKVRFTAPVPVGSRIRGHVTVESATPLDGAVQLALKTVIECENSEKPAAIVNSVVRYIG